jgi:RNA 3'-phosphate cyclase
MINVDGSIGEGGGAVLRTSLALSAAGQKPIHIFNIRAKRPKPGLQPQHLHGVKALAKLTNAKVKGLAPHSQELWFEPGPMQGGRYHVNIGTAGSVALILQVLMPAAAFANGSVEVEIIGGSDVPLAPPIDYLMNVTLPMLRKMGYRGEVELIQRGHYPRGGGKIRARIKPVQKLSPLCAIELGKVVSVHGISHCVKLPTHIATRQAHAAKRVLLQAGFDAKVKVESYEPSRDPHLGPGTGITLWALTDRGTIIGASSLGKPRKPAEAVGREAAEALLKQLKAGRAVDRYLTDQLISYMALADGKSEITSAELTLHALTNIALVERVMGVKFEVEGQLGQPGRISVEGLGLENKFFRAPPP